MSRTHDLLRRVFLVCATTAAVAGALGAQTPPPAPAQTPVAPSRASVLRGEYSRYRANNDLRYYHLDIRVDPDKKLVSGKNTIRFKMLQDDTRIQIDLYANLSVDRILLGATPLKYARELGAVFIDFPETLKKGRDVRHRLLLFRDVSAAAGTLRRARFSEGRHDRPRLDLHGVRGRADPASGGPARINGATKSRTWTSAWRSRTAWWTPRMAGSWARRTSATATRAGTGT